MGRRIRPTEVRRSKHWRHSLGTGQLHPSRVAVLIVALLAGGCDRASSQKNVQTYVRGDRMTLVANQYGANYSWADELRKELGYTGHLLTTDLERLWVGASPILFVGRMMDAVNVGPDSYILTFQNIDLEFQANEEIRMQLQCSKNIVEAARAEIPELSKLYSEGALVVAEIDGVVSGSLISSETVFRPEGNDPEPEAWHDRRPIVRDLRVGVGRCVAIEALNSLFADTQRPASI